MAISNNARGSQPGVCTSSTRPTAPYEGQTIYETDTDKVLVWNGSAWLYSATPQTLENGAWQSWTPTFSASSGTITTTTLRFAKYAKINKTIFIQMAVDITNAGSAGGFLIFNLPITAATMIADCSIGTGREYNQTGNALNLLYRNTTQAVVTAYNNGGLMATGYGISVSGSYEAA